MEQTIKIYRTIPRKSILIAACIIFSLAVHAQTTETITIKAGEDLSEVLSIHGLYKFPSFIYGTVLFRNGSSTKAKMNFNVFLSEIQFIDNKSDTLSIANPELIDSIKLDSTVFYYQKGYFYVIKDYTDTKLVVKEDISFETVKKGAYGLSSPSASIDTYNSLVSVFNTVHQLRLNEDILIKRKRSYALVYKKFRSQPATRSGFLNVFPGIKKEITDFVETNAINFSKEDDLKKLLDFCIQHS